MSFHHRPAGDAPTGRGGLLLVRPVRAATAAGSSGSVSAGPSGGTSAGSDVGDLVAQLNGRSLDDRAGFEQVRDAEQFQQFVGARGAGLGHPEVE